MRILVALALIAVPLSRVWGCWCVGASTPCAAAGIASAAFTGTVFDITDLPRPVTVGASGPAAARRLAGDARVVLPRPLRIVRIQVWEVLSGVDAAQKDIEILTGQGDGDCGYPFHIGADYVIYAYKNAEGRLETGICSRTRPLDQATEDVSYFHAMVNAPATGSIRVLTVLPGAPGNAGATIIVEQAQSRYRSTTNAAGDAMFSGMPPGEYTIHAESDGDLPDDPKVQLHATGCASVTLFRTLRLVGRVITRTGQPPARVEVQFRSAQDSPGDGVMTGPEGQYEIRIVRPGQYYLGINLNHTTTRDTPYPRWFYPGTEDPGLATRIDFTGKPEVRTTTSRCRDANPSASSKAWF